MEKRLINSLFTTWRNSDIDVSRRRGNFGCIFAYYTQVILKKKYICVNQLENTHLKIYVKSRT